jgi:hypothetical protein
MPQYTFRNKETGQTLTLEGERPPTEAELDSFFSQMAQQPAPAAEPAPQAVAPTPPPPTATPAAPERGLGTTIRELATEAGAGTAGQMIGTAIAPGVGTVIGGALGGGAGNLVNQLQRMSEDPNYKFRWGEFISDIGTGAIPGGALAKTGAKAVAKEAGKQALAGVTSAAVQKAIDEGELPTTKETLLAAAVPAVAGGAAQKILSEAPGAVAAVRKAFAGRPEKLRTFEAGATKGLKVVPSDLNPSFTTTQLESLGGKAAVNQRTQLANQDAVNSMVKQELGVTRDVELSPQVFKSIRERESKVYEQVDALAEKARKDLEKLQQARAAATNIADPAQRAIEEAKFNAKFGKKEAQLTEQATASLKDLREVRGNMQKMWDNYYASGGKNVDAQQGAIALKAQAEALEDTIDRVLRKTGKSALADRIVPARQRIAQSYNAEEMLNPGNFNIDPDAALRMLKRGVPLSGNLKLLAEFKAAFPNSLREASKVSSPDVSLLGTAAQGVVGGAIGLGTGNLPGAVVGAAAIPLARKGAREYLLSPGMQRRAYEAALPQAAAPLPLAAGTTAIRQAGQQVGQQATAAPTPTPQAVELLRKNPALAKEFDAKYGFGSARRYLKTP